MRQIMMKAIILAAGKGTRLGHYTKDIPKGMLQFNGKSLIEHQVKTYRKCGIDDILIITGYKAEKIRIPNVRYIFNEDYETTNMVESLFCAEKEFNDDIVVSYADILFESEVLKRLIKHESDIVVTTDIGWKEYWKARHGDIMKDTESLVFGEDGRIVGIGKPDPEVDDMHARYVGLIKFTRNGLEVTKRVYHEAKSKYWGKPWQTSSVFQKAYMTDLLQAIIDSEVGVYPLKIEKGWLEFDTIEDYEKTNSWAENGTISRFYSMDS